MITIDDRNILIEHINVKNAITIFWSIFLSVKGVKFKFIIDIGGINCEK